jgi:hypothetical protein
LPHPGGPPQDHRRRLAGLDRPAQRRFGCKKVVLAQHLAELPWPHAFGKRDGVIETGSSSGLSHSDGLVRARVRRITEEVAAAGRRSHGR